MSILQQPKPSIQHPPIVEPVASDGSPLRVIRDAQGQISEASGTGRDGVFRRLTLTNRSATNPAGFHFFGTQLDFFEQGKEYLRVGTIFSTDAGKVSVQAYSTTSQFGFAVGIARTSSQASLVTTTGSRVTIDLGQVLLRSTVTDQPSSVPASAVHGTLPPPPQDIPAVV
jgi:hypothetical protein